MNTEIACIAFLACTFTACAIRAGTIADAAAQPPGTEVTISDALILSRTDLVADPGFRSFQLRDVTRAITVYGTNTQIAAALTGWAEGDGINIMGVTAVADGALRLEPLFTGSVGGFAVSGRTSSAPFPFPTTALTVVPSEIAQVRESDLVCLQNVSFGASGHFTAETNYLLNGASAQMRIATGDLDLVGQPIPTGMVDITGIVIPDPDGDGYVLAPRSAGDIIPEPLTLAPLAWGAMGLLRRQRPGRF